MTKRKSDRTKNQNSNESQKDEQIQTQDFIFSSDDMSKIFYFAKSNNNTEEIIFNLIELKDNS